MFQTALDDGAGLVPRPSAAAGAAVLHLVNGTQSAAEPAQTEGRVGAQIIFHDNCSLQMQPAAQLAPGVPPDKEQQRR